MAMGAVCCVNSVAKVFPGVARGWKGWVKARPNRKKVERAIREILAIPGGGGAVFFEQKEQ